MCPPYVAVCSCKCNAARLLTTPALRLHQPRLFRRRAVVSYTVEDVILISDKQTLYLSRSPRLHAVQGLELYFPGVICWVDKLQLLGFSTRSFHFGLYLLVGEL